MKENIIDSSTVPLHSMSCQGPLLRDCVLYTSWVPPPPATLALTFSQQIVLPADASWYIVVMLLQLVAVSPRRAFWNASKLAPKDSDCGSGGGFPFFYYLCPTPASAFMKKSPRSQILLGDAQNPFLPHIPSTIFSWLNTLGRGERDFPWFGCSEEVKEM